MPLHESVGILGDLKHRSLGEVGEARAAVEVQVIWLAAQRITSGSWHGCRRWSTSSARWR